MCVLLDTGEKGEKGENSENSEDSENSGNSFCKNAFMQLFKYVKWQQSFTIFYNLGNFIVQDSLPSSLGQCSLEVSLVKAA